MSRYAALAGRIRTNLIDIQTTVDRAILLAEKASKSGDDGYWDGVALNLHSYYTGIEHIFEDIARTIDISLPSGAEWHLDLLLQMSGRIEGVRPAVLTRDARDRLDEYRGFRHVVRNVYVFNLRPLRLKELVESLPGCYQAVVVDLGNFADFLVKLDG